MDKKIHIPTGSLDTYLILYKELYSKYSLKCQYEKRQTEGGKEFSSGKTINNTDHLEYYLIEEAWQAIKMMLDTPLILLAKYSVGDKIKFIKETWVHPN